MPDIGAFPHYMLKEIFEQPQGLRDTIGPRVSIDDAAITLDDVRISAEELRALRRVNISIHLKWLWAGLLMWVVPGQVPNAAWGYN